MIIEMIEIKHQALEIDNSMIIFDHHEIIYFTHIKTEAIFLFKFDLYRIYSNIYNNSYLYRLAGESPNTPPQEKVGKIPFFKNTKKKNVRQKLGKLLAPTQIRIGKNAEREGDTATSHSTTILYIYSYEK